MASPRTPFCYHTWSSLKSLHKGHSLSSAPPGVLPSEFRFISLLKSDLQTVFFIAGLSKGLLQYRPPLPLLKQEVANRWHLALPPGKYSSEPADKPSKVRNNKTAQPRSTSIQLVAPNLTQKYVARFSEELSSLRALLNVCLQAHR